MGRQNRPHGRMTTVVAFELPITETAIDQLLAAEARIGKDLDTLPITAIDSSLAQTIDSELAGTKYTLYAADAGRGASGYVVALEIAGYIADIGGALATVTAGIHLTRRLYARLRERLGHPPLVSLGTACFLAAADLCERLSSTDFRLHGAGDTRGGSPDRSYSGNDCFYVIFDRGQDLCFYAVDAYGRVTFLGTAQMPQLR
jgi:hypothetical protein